MAQVSIAILVILLVLLVTSSCQDVQQNVELKQAQPGGVGKMGIAKASLGSVP